MITQFNSVRVLSSDGFQSIEFMLISLDNAILLPSKIKRVSVISRCEIKNRKINVPRTCPISQKHPHKTGSIQSVPSISSLYSSEILTEPTSDHCLF